MIRYATRDDLPLIMDIYRGAQKFMAETGNPTQWGNFYPTLSMLENDIAKKQLYVVVRDEVICGVFMFTIGDDPWYAVIENGCWMDDSLYGVIHRIASKDGEKGIFSEAKEFALALIGHLRIDTHADNKVMQHILNKNGFKSCGTIYVDDGTPRIAYEYIS